MAEKKLILSKNSGKAVKNVEEKRQKSFLSEVRGKQCFAFDFGEYATKLAVAKISDGKVDVKNLILIENNPQKQKLDAESIKDWRAAIMKAFSQNNISTHGQVGVCTINCRNYISRQLDIPFTTEKDRQGMVAFEMSQNLSLDVNAYLFQHKLLRIYESNGVKMCTVWAGALPRSQCGIYFDLMDSLRLRPLVMDINTNGLERLFSADASLKKQTENSVVATIDFGINGTEVNIFDKGIYSQGTNVEIGDGKLVSAAKRALGTNVVDIHNSNKLIVDSQKVYNILRQTKESEEARTFQSCIEEWLSAVNSVIKRYNLGNPDNQISQIFLYGGSMQLVWLRAYVEKYMGIPTKVMQQLDCCRIPSKMIKSSNTIPQFVNALSLLFMK